jgi:hypothetical protein
MSNSAHDRILVLDLDQPPDPNLELAALHSEPDFNAMIDVFGKTSELLLGDFDLSALGGEIMHIIDSAALLSPDVAAKAVFDMLGSLLTPEEMDGALREITYIGAFAETFELFELPSAGAVVPVEASHQPLTRRQVDLIQLILFSALLLAMARPEDWLQLAQALVASLVASRAARLLDGGRKE